MEEQQQQQQNPGSSLFELNLDASNSYMLRGAASWAKVLGVVGIILGALFFVLTVMALGQASNRYRSDEGFADIFRESAGAAGLGAAIMIITAVVFILGGIFSWQFGNRIGLALKANDQAGLDKGFAALRNYYALRSIVLIIVLLLFLISFAGSL